MAENANPAPEPAQQAPQTQPQSASQVPPAGQVRPVGQVPPIGQVPPAQGAQVPPASQVPPMQGQPMQGQVPPQQHFGAAPAVPPQPQNIPGMPLLYLTGGMKFGWAVLGFFVGPIAILVAWLTNAHNFPQAKSEAVKFSLVGFLISIVGWILLAVLFGFTACAAIGAAASGGYYY